MSKTQHKCDNGACRRDFGCTRNAERAADGKDVSGDQCCCVCYIDWLRRIDCFFCSDACKTVWTFGEDGPNAGLRGVTEISDRQLTLHDDKENKVHRLNFTFTARTKLNPKYESRGLAATRESFADSWRFKPEVLPDAEDAKADPPHTEGAGLATTDNTSEYLNFEQVESGGISETPGAEYIRRHGLDFPGPMAHLCGSNACFCIHKDALPGMRQALKDDEEERKRKRRELEDYLDRATPLSDPYEELAAWGSFLGPVVAPTYKAVTPEDMKQTWETSQHVEGLHFPVALMEPVSDEQYRHTVSTVVADMETRQRDAENATVAPMEIG